jgi:hypothetical protein
MKTLLTIAAKSRNHFFITAALLIVFLIQNSIVQAQSRWSLNLRPAANFPTKNLGNANLSTGFGLEAVGAYRFMPHVVVYGGWGWSKFSTDNSSAGTKLDFEETGYTFGLQFIHPISNSKINYMVAGGGIYNHIETEDDKGDIIADSGHGLGWQLETGISIPLSQRLHLIPGIRYRSLSRDINIENTITKADLNYISGGVGLSYSFK